MRDEVKRLAAPDATFFCNISLRPAMTVDKNGENLHRTIKPPQWWDDIFEFDEYHVHKDEMEMTCWKTL